ncbi:MAG: TonB-dependent receptor plug domain-containing protein [bacterium]|nr:TonB-dependent receptor plug domain-containing protein [bacterium]
MNTLLKTTIFLSATIGIFSLSSAQDMGLEELLAQEVNVASQKSLSIRETPGIITVITKEDIKNSGANDMIEVLRMVPGFFFGADVAQVVSIGIRGIWANEGKVLLLLDGHEMNELTYSNIMLGNHVPVELIEKIEIIRGPGSAKYGGFAELGVINIITRREERSDYIGGSLVYSQFEETYARRGGNGIFEKSFGDFVLDGSFSYKQAIRSNREYYDMYNDSFDMADNSSLYPLNAGLGVEFKDLEINLMVDRYDMTLKDVYDYALPKSIKQSFDSYLADVKYTYEINEKLKIVPSLKYKMQYPWQVKDTDSTVMENYWNLKAEKVSENLTFNYEHSEDFSFMAGEEYYYERCLAGDSIQVDFSDGSRKLVNQNVSVFSEILYRIPKVEMLLTAGGRVEYNQKYGYFAVPRAGLTKIFDKLHFKFLYSHAFRSPSFMNVDGSSDIEPEKTRSVELELGYVITPEMYIVGNIFDITILSPIVYYFDEETFLEGYINDTRIGTRGAEIDYRIKYKPFSLNISYSYYHANDNQVDLYSVEGREELLLGAPAHRAALSATYNFNGNIYLNLSGEYMTERYGYYSYDDVNEVFLSRRYPSIYMINGYVRYENLFMEHLSLGVFARNILDAEFSFVQPYDGSFAPLPALDREIGAKLTYEFKI